MVFGKIIDSFRESEEAKEDIKNRSIAYEQELTLQTANEIIEVQNQGESQMKSIDLDYINNKYQKINDIFNEIILEISNYWSDIEINNNINLSARDISKNDLVKKHITKRLQNILQKFEDLCNRHYNKLEDDWNNKLKFQEKIQELKVILEKQSKEKEKELIWDTNN